MRKKGLFLAAGLVAISASAIMSGSAFAAHSTTPLESEDDIKLAKALVNKTNLSNLVYQESGPVPYDGQNVIMVGDGEKPTSITFDCSEGDPLEGVKDYSLLNKDGIAEYFSSVRSLKLCGAADADWDELAKMPVLTSLVISPKNDEHNLSPSTMAELRDEMVGKPIVDISGVEKLTNIQVLCIIGVPLGSLQTIPQMNLEYVHLAADGIASIDGIKDVLDTADIDMTFNNIADFQPLMNMAKDVIRPDVEWSDIITNVAYYFNYNKALLKTNSETVELPGYFLAAINAAADQGNDVWRVAVDGMEYEQGATTAKLDLSKSSHSITVHTSTVDFTIEYVYEEKNDNPDTLDRSILGWVIGAAAAILASASFVVRSRR